MPTELIWDGKHNADGAKRSPLRIELPFQTVETVNESAQDRQRTYAMPQAKTSGEIIAFYAQISAQSLKLPAQFSALVLKIEQFFA